MELTWAEEKAIGVPVWTMVWSGFFKELGYWWLSSPNGDSLQAIIHLELKRKIGNADMFVRC